MAIKRKTDKPTGPTFTPDFNEHRRAAFTFQQMRDHYKDLYDFERAWVKDYLETNKDGVEVVASKALVTPEGSITIKQLTDWSIDKDALMGMIESGEVSLATVLNIANINATKLKDCIGPARFEEIAKFSHKDSIEFKANSDFKAQIALMLNGEVNIEPVASPEPKAEKPKSSLDKAKAAAAELDTILGE